MGQLATMRVPIVGRPRATTTLPTAAGQMWWKSDTPKTVIRSVSGDDALHLLNRAPDVNRGVVQSKVDQYARQMAAGLWRRVEEQCDALAFDIDGRCMNGQHRLWAVVESKATITFEIKVGLPTDAIDSIDDHLKRSDADVYKITHGGDATAHHMAIVLRLLMARGRPKGGYDRATKFDALERYKPMIDKAIALVQKNPKVKGLTAASLMAVLARATHTIQLEKLQRFAEVLKSGLSGDGEEPAILLRDWMMQNGAASSPLQNELYWKAERALRAFVDHDPIKTLYPAQSELFPLPGEVACRPADATSPRRLRERQARRGAKKR